MIPVQPQPEPEDFSSRVQEKGRSFLRRIPHPTITEWKNHAYWQDILPDMRVAYSGICAYSALWISPVTGSDSVDHFIPKNLRPELAYEWSNYRYASLKFNSRKGTQAVLDPFQIEFGWFILDFPSLLVKPHSSLPSDLKEAVNSTIRILKLNIDDKCVEARQHWVEDFCKGDISFAHLERKAPFIAYELKRQDLVEKIQLIMGV